MVSFRAPPDARGIGNGGVSMWVPAAYILLSMACSGNGKTCTKVAPYRPGQWSLFVGDVNRGYVDEFADGSFQYIVKSNPMGGPCEAGMRDTFEEAVEAASKILGLMLEIEAMPGRGR
jgi:hypothetical protein